MTEAAYTLPLVNSSSQEHLLALQAELARRPSRAAESNLVVRAALDAAAFLNPGDNPPESLRALRTISGYENAAFKEIGREALIALTGSPTGNKGLNLSIAAHHLEHRQVSVERWSAWLAEDAEEYGLLAPVAPEGERPLLATEPHSGYEHTAHIWEFGGTTTLRTQAYSVRGVLKAGGGGIAELSPAAQPSPTPKSRKKFGLTALMNYFS